MEYRYYWLKGKDISSMRFYYLYQGFFGMGPIGFEASKENVSEYQCQTNFVEVANQPMKVALCFRKYKKFPRLVDLTLELALVSESKIGFIAGLFLQGISEENGVAMVQKFLESVSWQD